MIPELLQGFSTDVEEMSLLVACLRMLRVSPWLALTPSRPRALLDNEAFRLHVDAVAGNDHYFYLSHRHYLAQGFTRRQRTALALHHYHHETTAFDRGYLDAVYREGGLSLWRTHARGLDYELKLQPGHDVLCEGGLSVVLFVDGGRVCVVSFSYVDRALVLDELRRPAGNTTIFITRKQLASNHDYQAGFNAAFDRCSAAHFALAALSGLAAAQGLRSAAALRAEAHPGFRPERRERFETAYDECWSSLEGRARSRFAFELPFPLQLTPLDRLSGKARRRAVRRRRHLDEIEGSARAALEVHRLASP